MDILLTQLVYTRISHDLSSPAGAVYNGTELLTEDLSFATQAASLIQSSADNLMKRLRFFRQTFGLQNKTDPDTTSDYLSTFSMPFSIKNPCKNNLERALIMALTDIFYRGAVFEIEDNYILATGDAIKDYPLMIDILEKGTISDNATDAPTIFAYAIANSLNKKLIFTKQNNSVKIEIRG